MAYPTSFLRLVVSGPLYTNERFSFGLNFMPDFGTPDVPTEVPPALVTAVTTFFQAGASIGPRAGVDSIKLNLLDEQGRYVSQRDTVQHDYGSPVMGSAGTVHHPAQIALAVTLRTGVRRGLASNGRFYLPCPSFTIDNGGLIAVGQAEQCLAGVNTFLTAAERALPGWDLAVMSKVREGAARPVTHVEIGRVLDTIRSRRKSLREDHIAGALHSPDL